MFERPESAQRGFDLRRVRDLGDHVFQISETKEMRELSKILAQVLKYSFMITSYDIGG